MDHTMDEAERSDVARHRPDMTPWLIVMLAVAFQAATYGVLMYSFTFWVSPWMTEFGASRSTVMTVISAHTIAIGIGAVVLGRWIDLIRPRLAVCVGLTSLCAGLVIIAYAHNIWTIMAVYVLVMPFAAVLAGPLMAMSLIAKNFSNHRGMAFGIAAVGTSLGGVILPLIVTNLLMSVGWRTTQVWLAIAIAALLILPSWIILSRERSEPRSATEALSPGRSATGSILRSRNFWILSFSYFFVAFVFSGLQFNLRPFAADLGLSLHDTAKIASGTSLAMIFGKLSIGALMDHFNHRVLFAASSATMAFAVILLMSADGFQTTLVGFGLLGGGAGAFLPLKGALFSEAFGAGAVGRSMGLAQPIVTLYALGPVLGGWLRDTSGSYASLFVSMLTVSILTLPLIFAFTRSHPAEVGSN